jgi:hypothetical protein
MRRLEPPPVQGCGRANLAGSLKSRVQYAENTADSRESVGDPLRLGLIKSKQQGRSEKLFYW